MTGGIKVIWVGLNPATGVLTERKLGADTRQRMPHENTHTGTHVAAEESSWKPQGATDGQLPPGAYRFQERAGLAYTDFRIVASRVVTV